MHGRFLWLAEVLGWVADAVQPLCFQGVQGRLLPPLLDGDGTGEPTQPSDKADVFAMQRPHLTHGWILKEAVLPVVGLTRLQTIHDPGFRFTS